MEPAVAAEYPGEATELTPRLKLLVSLRVGVVMLVRLGMARQHASQGPNDNVIWRFRLEASARRIELPIASVPVRGLDRYMTRSISTPRHVNRGQSAATNPPLRSEGALICATALSCSLPSAVRIPPIMTQVVKTEAQLANYPATATATTPTATLASFILDSPPEPHACYEDLGKRTSG